MATAICTRCAEPLVKPSDDGLCGFCQGELQEERALPCDTCGEVPDDIYGCRCEAPGADKEGE